MVINVKTKQWGHSLGLIIPQKEVKNLDLKPGEEITIEITKKHNVLKELFGALKFSKPTKELLKEVREDMESKYI